MPLTNEELIDCICESFEVEEVSLTNTDVAQISIINKKLRVAYAWHVVKRAGLVDPDLDDYLPGDEA